MSRKLEPTAYAGAAAVTEMLVLLTVGIVAQGGVLQGCFRQDK
ncbi:MAG: hypothetical protein ABEK59_05350 [Halobacteria archaeon]